MPCGQKNKTSEMVHNQTVTPPLAAMEGTTLRLKTATTKRRTRSHRPRTRRRRGASGLIGAAIAIVASFAKFVFSRFRGAGLPTAEKHACPARLQSLHADPSGRRLRRKRHRALAALLRAQERLPRRQRGACQYSL